MHAFDAENRIIRYNRAEDICAEHYRIRLEAYVRRKEALERRYSFDEAIASAKSKFISSIVSGDIKIMRSSGGTLPMSELTAILSSSGFMPYEALKAKFLASSIEQVDDEGHGFSYLVNMPLQTLTSERASALHKQALEAMHRLNSLRKHSPQSLWREDLERLKQQLLHLNRSQ